MQRTRQARRLGYGVAALIAIAAITLVLQAGPEGVSSVEIRTTSYGVPHVRAADFGGAGYGVGYASAESNICAIAERWLTVNAQRSKYFGPDTSAGGRTRSSTNLESDFFWARILDMDVIGNELQEPPPLGPTPELRELIRGYVAGYNRYLQDTGVGNLPDPRCRGKEWVRPITEMDVYLRALEFNIPRTIGLIDELGAAQPPSGRVASVSLPPPAAADLGPTMMVPEVSVLGSNVIALGKDATDNGRGMVFANPHWSWVGAERWWEFHMTVPGEVNVNGSGVLGIPVVVFGHTGGVAWSHTASTPRRYTVYELTLASDSPTSYMYDGQVREMTPRTVTVEVKEKDGGVGSRSHTFWETHYGPTVKSEYFPWTSDKAFAIRAAAMTVRWLNQQLEMNRSNSVAELDAAGLKYLAIGWLNTVAADSSGNALFADRTPIPYVTDEKVAGCATSTKAPREPLPALDGSRSECEWANDPSTPVPGIFPASMLPQLERADYVTNSNDSYWTTNRHALLEGYPRIMGDERTRRTMRTRRGLVKVERRLNGTDGHPGKKFTLDQLEAITMNNRLLAGELWRDELVSLCRTMPAQEGFPQACDVLATWDLTEDTGSVGALLFRRFFENLFASPGNRTPDAQDVYTVPFDPNDPMNTPRGLNASNPKVSQALTAAVNDLLGSGIPLDAKYGDYHFVERNGTKIAIPGGPAAPGQYNMITARGGWQADRGYANISSGSSYIMWLQFTDTGLVGRSLSTYSQTDNPSSPHYADQTKLFSAKRSKPILFDEAAIEADPNLTVTTLDVNLPPARSNESR